MNIRKLLVLIIAAVVVFMQSCTSPPENESDQLQVVATTGMVADLVKNIGKEEITVTALMGPGVDPHLYKATQGDLSRLQAADIIFYNGLHLEGKMGEVFEKLGKVKTVIPVAAGIAEDLLLADPAYEEAPDPHIWFDVSLWAQTIAVVTQTLSEKAPEKADYFQQNAAAFQQQLTQLHQWVQEQIQQIPPEKRILITAHDAFSYFGNAYGIEVRGLQGISTLSEFGLRDRVDLVNFIVEKQINAVFVETSVSEKNINSIVEGCQQRGHEVRIGGNLFSDAMGAEGTPEGSYIGMVRANVNAIVAGLAGNTESNSLNQ
jgi:manganese/zinc/iron transport system substrate-binding protein